MSPVAKPRSASSREVVCTHCGRSCDVARRAMSVVCPHCNKRLILEDFKIKGYYGVREFDTCGDILVEKSGTVAAKIKAGNLIVHGAVQGSAVAIGRVSLHRTGSFKGDIQAPRLRVEPGAKLSGFLRIGPTTPTA